MSLAEKMCIITGGGSGIGRGAALMMARKGAQVALVGRTSAKVEAVKAEIVAEGGAASAHALDVADADAVKAMVEDVKAACGRVDVLVNSAGHSSLHRRLLTTTPEEVRRVIDSNLVGTIFCTQAVLPTMLEAKRGTIVNVSSLAAVTPGPFSGVAYGAAKAGVNNFTEFIAAEFRNSGIRACAIMPGEVDSPILEGRPIPPSDEARATMVGVEEVAETIALIAGLPRRTTIPLVTIRPTMQRDFSQETERMPDRER